MNAPPMSAVETTDAVASDDPIAIEPGRTSGESMLITTDSFDEIISTFKIASGDNSGAASALKAASSNISEIQDELHEQCSATQDQLNATEPAQQDDGTLQEIASASSPINESGAATEEESNMRALELEWIGQSDHVFVLSTAGKPIYTLHGNEDTMSTKFCVMQVLVSVVQSSGDTIRSIHADDGMKIVFLVKPPLTLVAVSKSKLSVQQIQLQLKWV